MWDLMKDQAMANQREAQLTGDFWQVLIEGGATAHRFYNTPASAWSIVGDLLSLGNGGDDLLLQEELVEQQKRLNETEAGKAIYNRLQKLLSEQRRTVKELAEEARQQDDSALAKSLQEEYDKVDAQLQRTFEQMPEMKAPLSTPHTKAEQQPHADTAHHQTIQPQSTYRRQAIQPLPHATIEQPPLADADRRQTTQPPPHTKSEEQAETDTDHRQTTQPWPRPKTEQQPHMDTCRRQAIQPQTDAARRQTIQPLPHTKTEQQHHTDTGHHQTIQPRSVAKEDLTADLCPLRTGTSQQPQEDTDHPPTIPERLQVSEELVASVSVEDLETDDIVIAYVS